jgi:hypothetical protein
VFLAPSIPAITSELPPGEKQRPWPPISSTLIFGERDAVLVDTPITVEQARALADWVVASGKNLTTLYATHGHGDHFFGTSTVLERFPGARFVARPDVIKVMRQQASPESLATFWNPRFPGQISSHLAIAEELTGNVIDLEGHDLVTVPLGFTDTANTTSGKLPPRNGAPASVSPLFPQKIPDASRVLLSSNIRVSLRIASRPSDAAVVVGPA